MKNKPKSVEEVSLRDFIEEQLYTMLEVTSVMQPKSDKEFIAVALPNLHTKVFERITQNTERVRREDMKQILCREDIDGDVCDCCRANYDRIDDLI